MLTRRSRALFATSAAIGALLGTSVQAAITPPVDWPVNPAMQPSLDTWPHAIRLAGDDRYQTGLTASLTLRGTGGAASYPYGSPDPATSSGSYGLDSCPRAVIVVAGDNPADALTASSLSDPTGQSSEPYLRISTSADQVFDPVGDFRRVDTDFAPILITASGRQGATALNIATRLAAQDLRNGACSSAREAIVVGGTSAVPLGVENELVSIGYERVYRVAGASRYATARAVAESLGTAAAPPQATACFDDKTNDGSARMAFYANSVIEYRTDSDSCDLMPRTVVLADGTIGADALAAGWWTSYWQVPVLLHDGSNTLPSATEAALQTLSIDNLIVLGGPGRISESIAQQAAALATAALTRVSGSDRYDTSVIMAQRFGGWHATGRGDDFAGSQLCIAASSGGTPTQPGLGWADALAAGPWCARSAAAARNAPVRALTPTNGVAPILSSVAQPLVRPAHDAVPVILVPAGSTATPATVGTFMSSAFPTSDTWCSSASNIAGCTVPGFAVAFGGASIVPDPLMSLLSSIVAGSTVATSLDRAPELANAFVTNLDLSPVYATGGNAGATRVCVPRAAVSNARWLVARAEAVTTLDLMSSGRYVADADGVPRSRGVSSPACLAVAPGVATEVRVWASGLAGQRSAPTDLGIDPDDRLSLGSPIVTANASFAFGTESSDDSSAGGSTTWTFWIVPPGTALTSRSTTGEVTGSSLTLNLARGTDGVGNTAPDTFTATFSLLTGLGSVTGSARGEAIRVETGPGQFTWKLRGEAIFSGGSWNVSTGQGGFSADVVTSEPGLADDSATWTVDGWVAGSP